ncbi:DMT family transporter [uncultured Cohaesibacter sp.]|uniref:DMT family transporter n=1 Tax=uncultured Cohaesibacter sp. TaxID=1002546 RepID=UPI0029C625FC|nr:DMT family transporter [uncultured Cohaesibacter sp.]
MPLLPDSLSAEQRGSLFMILAMAGFSLEDMLLKRVMAQVPVGEVLVLFGLGGMLVFAWMAQRQQQAIFAPGLFKPTLALRSLCEIAGRVFYALAIALTPLSSASAILQATPLVVAVGAVIFFHEKVGPRRWTAILIGFLGVLLILRPGFEGFEPASIFAVLGTLGFAGRDLGSRAAPPSMSNAQLGVYGFLMLIISGAVLLAITGGATVPDGPAFGQLLVAIGFGVLAYNSLSVAMRSGAISVVAPFRYTRLIFAMLLGMLVFAERPDGFTLLGNAIIVLSGLYTLYRSR